jgi:preprotein translocase subunit SecD
MTRRKLLTPLLTLISIGLIGVISTLIAGARPALGLDLQGGASVVLQPVESGVDSERLATAAEIIRQRVDSIGVAEPEIRTQGDTIVVELPGVKDQDTALELVGQTGELRFRPVLAVEPGKDAAAPPVPASTTPSSPDSSTPGSTTADSAPTSAGGASSAPNDSAAPDSSAAPTTATPTTAARTSAAPPATAGRSKRLGVTSTPTSAPSTTLAPTDTSAPGDSTVPADSTAPSDSGAPAESAAPDDSTAPSDTVAPGDAVPTDSTLPPNLEVVPPVARDADGLLTLTGRAADVADAEVVLPLFDGDNEVSRYRLGPALMIGTAVDSASQRVNPGNGESEVVLTIRDNDEANAAFASLSAACYSASAACPPQGLGDDGGLRGAVAIVVDGRVISAPQWNLPSLSADREVLISGSFSDSEAKDLAKLLNFGALPVVLEPQATQTVSATLGKDSLRAGLIAGAIGVGLVVLLMCLYYRALGLVVLAGLCVSASLMWSIIAWLGESRGLALTLAGATGIIVSIGVTVDSYVVYFERLKDDVRLGRTLRSSAERGFKGAYRTIIAADLVSLLAAGLLWWLTVGSVRGFAFFLGISTMLDMIIAYWFTRPLVILLSRTKRFAAIKVLGVTTGEAAAAAGGIAPRTAAASAKGALQ